MNRTVSPTAGGRIVASWLALLLILLSFGVPDRAEAQQVDTSQYVMQRILPDTVIPIRPIYGFEDDEFSIGSYIDTHPPGDTAFGHIWNFADLLGLKILEWRGWVIYDTIVDGLADAATGKVGGKWDQRVIYADGFPGNIGWSQEVTFYPFDSSQSYYWPCKFLDRRGGVTKGNIDFTVQHALNGQDSLYEQVYDSTNTTAGDTVCQHVAYGYDPIQIYRYHLPAYETDSVQRSDMMFVGHVRDVPYPDRDHPTQARGIYLVVTGHLFDPSVPGSGGGGANNSDTLLAIDIWHEIPQGSVYLDHTNSDQPTTAASNLELLYATIYVRKSDLLPDVSVIPLNYDLYRSPAYHVDLVRQSPTGMFGPYDDFGGASHRFDVRVRWTGKEKLALRSVALRDSITQLLLGTDSTYRVDLYNRCNRIFRGQDTTKPLRTDKIIRLYTGDEGWQTMYTGYNYLDSMLYRHFGSTPVTAHDSLVRGVRAWRAEAAPGYLPRQNATLYTNSSENEMCVETYQHYDYGSGQAASLGVSDWDALPSIAHHNGGRFGIPLLALDSNGTMASNFTAVDHYEKAMQRAIFRAYRTSFATGNTRGGIVDALGQAAWASRRTGRRIIQWPGIHQTLSMTWRFDPALVGAPYHCWMLDTTFYHLPERGEMRAMVNLGVCYGSRGVHYSFIGSNSQAFDGTNQTKFHPYQDSLVPTDTGHPLDAVVRHNYSSDWGPVGHYYNDSVNYRTTMIFHDPNTGGSNFTALHGFYTGYTERQRELKWLDKVWLPAIGNEMVKLRWRDGYSMYFTVRQSYFKDKDTLQVMSRPLPAGEVVRSIETWDRYGRKDSTEETYVELGLFDKKTGTTGGVYDPMKDTTHIYLVNRRTFERPSDISDTSKLGKLMDSLAGTRTLIVSLHIPHPDTTQYNFVHVQEIVPDTSRLPGMNVPRAGLDTVVYGDSTIALTLRPGGGALLRITYAPPDSSLNAGDLRFNNQRKILFDGNRYYSCYQRNDSVLFRRSLPVTNQSGAILWLPTEECVSCNGDSSRTQNRYPSLTLRHQNTDTIISIVWTAHPKWGYSHGVSDREVLLREYAYGMLAAKPPLYYTRYRNIEHVDFHAGVADTTWGTPVICREDGGCIIAWSDSLWGIVGRVQRLDTLPRNFIPPPSVFSNRALLSYFYDDSAGRYPSVPTFAHITRHDSTCGLVWQMRWKWGGPNGFIIPYLRLVHTRTSLGADTLISVPQTLGNPLILSSLDSANIHPSIDLQQDGLRRRQEAVTWEIPQYSDTADIKGIYHQYYGSEINYCSVLIDTVTSTPLVFKYGSTAKLWLRYPENQGNGYGAYPNIAAINRIYSPADSTDSSMFAIVFQQYDPILPTMQQATIRYGSGTFFNGWPRTYAWGGEHPNGAASPVKQNTRYAALYEQQQDSSFTRVLRTSRQFFAKMRPGNYVATGRRAILGISDSLRTGIAMTLHDVWYSTASSSGPAAMIDRTDPIALTDSVAQAETLLRSRTFHAWDSTMVGCEVEGEYQGDSSIGSSARIDGIVELVDSASDSAVARLDSFSISAACRHHHVVVSPTVDLTSGAYYVRLRLSSAAYPPGMSGSGSRYPVDELASWVEDERGLGKLRRIDESAAELTRLTAQPNPFNAGTEIRFTVSRERKVMLRVLDDVGREVARPVDGVWTVPGRYAIDLDGDGLRAGTYLVDLDIGGEHTLTKVVLVR